MSTTPLYKGLDKLPVYTTDTDNSIFGVTNIPNTFPLGKTYFLILGSDKFKKFSNLDIEILDSEGETVEFLIPEYLESRARAISINVQTTTAVGVGKITIVGTLKDSLVPDNWKGRQNVKWQSNILINPFLENVNKIKLLRTPNITVSEEVDVFVNYPSSSFALQTFSSGSIKLYPYVSTRSRQVLTNEYILELNNDSFNSSFLNGSVTIEIPNDTFSGRRVKNPPSQFTAKIKNIINPRKAILDKPATVRNLMTGKLESFSITSWNSNYEIQYTEDVSGSATIQSESYARIDINNLKTFSGKVQTIDLYKNNIGSSGDWELMGTYPLEAKNLFTTGSASIDVPMGNFINQDYVTFFWESNYGTINWNTNQLLNSIELASGSITRSQFPFNIYDETDYTIEYTLKSTEAGSIQIYVSGSGYVATNSYGKYIETISTTSPRELIKYKSEVRSDSDGTMFPVFRVMSGTWYISNVKIYSTTNFGVNPSHTIVKAPINPKRRDTAYKFKLVYNNPVGESCPTETIVEEPVFFTGENTYIDGAGNIITGSLVIGSTLYSGIEFAGTNSAYIRNIDYQGYYEAKHNIGGAGFLIWSGSVLPLSDITNQYSGVGVELVTSESHLRFRTDPASLDVKVNSFFVGNPNIQFISGGGSIIEISSSNFWLDSTGNVYIQGTVSASAGNIGGWEILDGKLLSVGGNMMLSGSGVISSSNFYVNEAGVVTAEEANIRGTITADSGSIGNWELTNGLLSGSNITLDANGSSIYMSNKGPGSDITAPLPQLADEYYIDFTPDPALGFYVKFGPNFMVDDEGILIASGATFEGSITASAGVIGGFIIEEEYLRSSNSAIIISGSPQVGGYFISTSNFNVKQNGDITGSAVQFTGGTIAGFTINGTKLSQGNSFYLDGNISGNYFISSSAFTVNPSGYISSSAGKIGGWDISNQYLTSSGLILNSDGSIYSSNYISNQSGFMLTSAYNGYAEFQNVKIRGTLSTTVFEKETISVVGGQVMVGNATTIEENLSDTDTTMSVANASSFSAGEIILVKKFDNTGFSVEYMLINSASVDNSSTGEGTLFVQRGYENGSIPIGHPEISFSASSANSYDQGQVVISTAKSGSGWVLINANPADQRTPYIDIVERTGSGLYDTQLKVRLGDLSGIPSNLLFGNTSPGFGIYTLNGFFTGGITATTGSFTGKVYAGNMILGTNVNDVSNNGMWINANNYWYDNGLFKVGGSNDFISWSGARLTVAGEIFITAGGNIATTSSLDSVSSSIDSTIGVLSGSVDGTITNLSSSVSGSINNLSSSVDNTIYTLSGSIDSTIDTEIINLSSSLDNVIMNDAYGKLVKTPTENGNGLYLKSTHLGYYNTIDGYKAFISSSGEFLFKANDNNLLSFGSNSFILKVSDQATISGSNINLLTPNFFFGNSNTSYLSGSSGKLEISSSNFYLQPNGDVYISGSINAPTGSIAGWDIGNVYITKDQSYISSNSPLWEQDWNLYSGSRKIIYYEEEFTNIPSGSNLWVYSGSAGPDFNSGWQSGSLNVRLYLPSGSDGIGFASSSLIPISGGLEETSYTISFDYSTQETTYALVKVYDGNDNLLKNINLPSNQITPTQYNINLITSASNLRLLYELKGDETHTIYKESTIVIWDPKTSGFVSRSVTIATEEYVEHDFTLDNINISSWTGFAEWSNKGLYVFNNPQNYAKIGNNVFELKGQTLDVENINVANNLVIYGDFTVYGNQTLYTPAQDFYGTTAPIFTINLSEVTGSSSLIFGNSSNFLNFQNDIFTLSHDLIVNGSIQFENFLFDIQENTDIDIGTEVISTIDASAYSAVFFDFVIKNGTNIRAGTVYAIHDGTNVEYTETSTRDLGDTSPVTLEVDLSGGNLRLKATVTTNNWIVKSLARGL